MDRARHLRLTVSWACRALLGLVFIYAAISKLGAPQDFADSLAAFRLLPAATINILAWGLPLFELCCGLCLWTGFWIRAGFLGILLLLVFFTIAIVSALVRGLPVDCGCFGPHSWLDTNPWLTLTRDVLLLTMAAIAYKGLLLQDKTATVATN